MSKKRTHDDNDNDIGEAQQLEVDEKVTECKCDNCLSVDNLLKRFEQREKRFDEGQEIQSRLFQEFFAKQDSHNNSQGIMIGIMCCSSCLIFICFFLAKLLAIAESLGFFFLCLDVVLIENI